MARIPFITPVPTAIARTVAYYSFSPDYTAGNGDCFSWCFIPEALASATAAHAPFMYGSGSASQDINSLGNGMLRHE
jgi:hypothetical protein